MRKRISQGIDLLADPTRRAIVAHLALDTGQTNRGQPSRIAAEIGLSRPATSRQLRLLREAGLISAKRHYVDGRKVIYFIEPRRLGQIAAWLAGTEVGRAFPQTSPPEADYVSAWIERTRITLREQRRTAERRRKRQART